VTRCSVMDLLLCNTKVLYVDAYCERSAYDRTFYFGKSGDGWIWRYGSAEHGDSLMQYQESLVWWHYCTYAIEGGAPLVLRKAWTVHSDRGSRVFDEFISTPNYRKFGLHIDEPEGAWGCLSNVGIVLGRKGIPGFTDKDAGKKWYVAKTTPSTLNPSVETILRGTSMYAEANGAEGLAVLGGVAGVLLNQSQGLEWGEVKENTTNMDDPDSMVSQLFDILQGIDLDGLGVINEKADLRLTADTAGFNYYDPGLAAVDLEANPGDELFLEEPAP